MVNPGRVEQAIKDYQAGKNCEESFRLIDEYYRPRLIKFFANRGFSPELQEDLTQDVFSRVSKGMVSFRGESLEAFSAWLFQIADNIRRDQLRRQATQKREAQTISLEGGGNDGESLILQLDLPDSSQSSQPDETLIDSELKQRLKKAVMKLPKQQRYCLFLQLYHELSVEKIADIMQIKVDTVKAHLKVGKAKLKADLVFD